MWMKWPSLYRNTLCHLWSVLPGKQWGFTVCVLPFLALVAVSSPCSLCWFHGACPKAWGKKRQTNKLNTNMRKSQGLINFWWKKTVTGTDIYPMKEIFECYCVRQDAMTKKKVLRSRILGGNVTVPWQESQVAKVTDSSWTGLPMPCSRGWGGNWRSKEVVAGTWQGGEGKEKGQ